MASFICVMAVLVLHALSANANGDTYTTEELHKLSKLRAKVKNELTQEYMSKNKYLVRFLRARRLDVNAAEEMLRKSLKWRKEQKMDNILSEDFSWWEARYSFYLTNDHEGRPALVSGLKQIDFRKYALAGKGPLVIRYIYYAFERGIVNLERVHNETGLEFISGHLLFNLAGYNARSYACLACLPFWIDLAQVYENYYPQYGKKLITINSPRIFQSLFSLVSPFLTPGTAESARIYGHDKQEWKREVLKVFPAENLTPEFGGTLKLK